MTFNKDNTYDFFRERIEKLDDIEHDPTDLRAAYEKALSWDDKIYTGVYYRNDDVPALNDEEPVLEAGPVAVQPEAVSKEAGERIIKRMM